MKLTNRRLASFSMLVVLSIVMISVNLSKREDAILVDGGSKKLKNKPTSVKAPVDLTESPKEEDKHLTSFLIIFVASKPDNVRERRAIRTTWARGYTNSHTKVVVRFAMGTDGLNETMINLLHRESSREGDIIFLPDLYEHYNNLTRKTMRIFQWTTANATVAYLMKVDDNSYLRINTILTFLQNRNSTKCLYLGNISWKAKPVQNTSSKAKNIETNWHLGEHYLPYARGPGYILSYELVKIITESNDKLSVHFYQAEDVSVGVWVAPFDVEYFDASDTFLIKSKQFKLCGNNTMLMHPQTFTSMQRTYDRLVKTGLLCEPKFLNS